MTYREPSILAILAMQKFMFKYKIHHRQIYMSILSPSTFKFSGNTRLHSKAEYNLLKNSVFLT